MMGIFFGGVNRRNSNLVVTTACRPALQNLNKAAESTDWRPIPNLAGTIFDKVVYVNFSQSSGYGWTKDDSPIPFSDERIHLIENRAPVLSPIYARADPLAHQRGNFHIPFCPTYPNHLDEGES